MKIEIDHQELQTILEHHRKSLEARSTIEREIVRATAPVFLEKLGSLFAGRRPQIVPDEPVGATGTDEG